jgi:hypothetical protein
MNSVFPVCLLIASALQGQGADKKEQAEKDPALRQELLDMFKEDQQIRVEVLKALGEKGIAPGETKRITDPALMKFALEQNARMTAVDQKNLARLKQIVDKHGWPGKSLVGVDGAHAAWLLVQHADAKLGLQKRYLELMKAAPKGDVEPIDIACLTDRVLVAEKKKQVYGTQLVRQGDKYVPKSIQDAESVDKRRAEVGLPPLADYLKTAQAEYDRLLGKKNEK